MWIGQTEYYISLAVDIVLLALHLYALVDAGLRPSRSYAVASSYGKPLWLLWLGVAAAIAALQTWMVVVPYSLLWVVSTVLVGFYLAEVRPQLGYIGEARGRRR